MKRFNEALVISLPVKTMILCKWRKGHNRKGQNYEDGDLECDGTYRSYKVDDVSLNGQDMNLEENEFQPDNSSVSQSLIEVNVKNVTSTNSRKGFSANDLIKTSLTLNSAKLGLDSEKLELPNFQAVSSDPKTTEKETPFFSHLMNFFTSLICGSRSILTLDSDVTISTIKKLSCETVEENISNIGRIVTGYNDSEGRNGNKPLRNINLRKTTEVLTHQRYSLRKANSLPNIKLKDFKAKSNFIKERDVLIVYPEVQSMEEQVKLYEASLLRSTMFFKSMKANDCFDIGESDVSGTDLLKLESLICIKLSLEKLKS